MSLVSWCQKHCQFLANTKIIFFLSKLIKSIYLWTLFKNRKERSLQIHDLVYIIYPALCSLFVSVNRHASVACLLCRKIGNGVLWDHEHEECICWFILHTAVLQYRHNKLSIIYGVTIYFSLENRKHSSCTEWNHTEEDLAHLSTLKKF